ncbi:MAG: hypothetical protein K0R64_3397 [Novosphingobium lindaniclasticum]|jgi:hypothetical protein|uniref:hypothetical protein n=1 Tax=Novosphingobium lindaniclasticum TaxID=1329895 RepID=UPI0024098238|nr:hypothetical protein [Novosphingobium lindaniclasticum]MDF2640413.1 hypothetical protein [Novosphingobium lindaniclasticum]
MTAEPSKGRESPLRPSETGADLESVTEESLGGVQGAEPGEDSGINAQVAKPGAPADQPAPDAGEIEWAGQVIRKPPSPQR